jgi:hypothetical protein
MRRFPLVTSIAVLTALFAWALVGQTPGAKPPTSATVTRLEARVAALEKRLAAVEAQLAQTAGRPGRSAPVVGRAKTGGSEYVGSWQGAGTGECSCLLTISQVGGSFFVQNNRQCGGDCKLIHEGVYVLTSEGN